ncbi:erythroblast NAD(P)(+)--arginine ADP-ribosyltransferase-like [Brachyhypopomus gauderio]|uniref:erythroblast NAD(P)(+)--arginine ADP-ribosyltransferase-like n=1 Tax=Brachyhypopomus gauderio TaxID=698409 RepID=UPI0040436EDF
MKVLVWMLKLLAYLFSVWKVHDDLPLDMAEQSVDDSFKGCRDQMYLLIPTYLEKELKSSNNFPMAWRTAQNRCKSDDILNKNQSAALYAYTLGGPKPVYSEFNHETRTGKEKYSSDDFPFYTLYFFLTDAIQQLKRNKCDCLTSYRRTSHTFVTDVLNQEIRFGSFTSSSLLSNLSRFGDKSCFIIHTCFGAEIYNYSSLPEQEVLIPPYEVFIVTSVEKKSEQKDLWCEVVYTLNSTQEIRSDLKCAKVSALE